MAEIYISPEMKKKMELTHMELQRELLNNNSKVLQKTSDLLLNLMNSRHKKHKGETDSVLDIKSFLTSQKYFDVPEKKKYHTRVSFKSVIIE